MTGDRQRRRSRTDVGSLVMGVILLLISVIAFLLFNGHTTCTWSDGTVAPCIRDGYGWLRLVLPIGGALLGVWSIVSSVSTRRHV